MLFDCAVSRLELWCHSLLLNLFKEATVYRSWDSTFVRETSSKLIDLGCGRANLCFEFLNW